MSNCGLGEVNLDVPPSQRRRVLCAAVTGTIALAMMVLPVKSARAANATDGTANDEIRAALEEIRVKYNAPALGGGIAIGNEMLEFAATGLRNGSTPDRVTDNDVFHFGSITKSFNSTILAKLVEEGKFTWDSTLESLLPDLTIVPDLRKVTLAMLASHRSGIQGILTIPEMPKSVFPAVGELSTLQQRTDYAQFWLARQPLTTPGTAYAYSPAGTIIAAHIAERASGKRWEQLASEIIFNPLGMTSCSLGVVWPTATMQPMPHRWLNGAPQTLPMGFGNTRLNDGSDQVRCSIADLLKFGRAHAQGETEGGILSKESFKILHSPRWPQDNYGFNWGNTPAKPWSGGSPVLWHSGSNTGNFAYILFAPGSKAVIALTANIGFDEAGLAKTDAMMQEGLGRLATLLLKRLDALPKPTVPPTTGAPAASATVLTAGSGSVAKSPAPAKTATKKLKKKK
jgi:CubicO group peptidase (beta-lactamase class C family)